MARANLAAVDIESATVLPWAPVVAGGVTSLDAGHAVVAVAGEITAVDGLPVAARFAAIEVVTGALRACDLSTLESVSAVAFGPSEIYVAGERVGGIGPGGRRLNIATGDSLLWDVGVSGVTQLLATPIHVFLRTTVAVIAGFPSSGIGDPLPLAGMPTAMALTGTSVLVATQSVGGLNQVAAFSLFSGSSWKRVGDFEHFRVTALAACR